MRGFLRSTVPAPILSRRIPFPDVARLRDEYAQLDDRALDDVARHVTGLADIVAVTAVVASRVLGLQMFDRQIAAALALGAGHIVEMQTGEGKTLAAVPAIAWYARAGRRRARADRERLSRAARRRLDARASTTGSACRSASSSRTMTAERTARRLSRATSPTRPRTKSDSTICATGSRSIRRAGACGRSRAAVIDEADSILIDEARIPLVIAGGAAMEPDLRGRRPTARCASCVPRHHFTSRRAAATSRSRRPASTASSARCGCAISSTPEHLARARPPSRTRCTRTCCSAATSTTSCRTTRCCRSTSSRAASSAERRWPAGLQTALECKEARATRNGRAACSGRSRSRT